MMRLQEQVARRSELEGEIKRNLAGGMSAEWPTMSLKEANVSLIDCVHRTPPPADSGYPYVAIPQMKAGRIDVSDARKISKEHLEEWTKKAKPVFNDVILSRRCNPGETAFVERGLQCALGQNLVLLRADGTKVYPPFLRWLARSPEWWGQVEKFINAGAVFDSLKCKDIPNFQLTIPPIENQKDIADFLGALDDKIEINRQINQTLEQIAQTIFKSWFVDFEPVKAKIEAKAAGRDPERGAMCAISGKLEPELDELPPEQFQQLAATTALFPDGLVESELGLIPAGWEVGSFQKCCERVESGGTPSRTQPEYWNGSVPWLTSGEVRDVIVLDSKEKITEKGLADSSAKLWPVMSTVVAMYGATAGQICLLANEMAANQACCALIPKKEYQAFVFFSARRSIEDLAGKASGSAQQNLNKSLVANHAVVMPSREVANSFETTSSPLVKKWIANQRESHSLTTLRDTLLPKLLSGELSIETLPLEATA